jgi:chromosome segregation ATPase
MPHQKIEHLRQYISAQPQEKALTMENYTIAEANVLARNMEPTLLALELVNSQNRNARLATENQNQASTIRQIEWELSVAFYDRDEARGELQNREDDLRDAHLDYHEIGELVTAKETTIADFQGQIQQLCQQLADRDMDIQSLEREKAEAIIRADGLRQVADGMSERIKEQRVRLATEEQAHKQTQEMLTVANENHRQLKQQLRLAQRENGLATQQASEISNELNKIEEGLKSSKSVAQHFKSVATRGHHKHPAHARPRSSPPLKNTMRSPQSPPERKRTGFSGISKSSGKKKKKSNRGQEVKASSESGNDIENQA